MSVLAAFIGCISLPDFTCQLLVCWSIVQPQQQQSHSSRQSSGALLIHRSQASKHLFLCNLGPATVLLTPASAA